MFMAVAPIPTQKPTNSLASRLSATASSSANIVPKNTIQSFKSTASSSLKGDTGNRDLQVALSKPSGGAANTGEANTNSKSNSNFMQSVSVGAAFKQGREANQAKESSLKPLVKEFNKFLDGIKQQSKIRQESLLQA